MKLIPFDLSSKRVLVTGGTGFIGGRLVERLVLECNANVRVLVRNFARASRIARFPVEIIRGDVTEPGDVERAVSECDIIFHCAWAIQNSGAMERRVNVQGTKNVLEAALRAGAKRTVCLSTILVYGTTSDGELDETTPRGHLGNAYAKSKFDAEKMALSYVKRHGLPVTVLQPTVVYGPFAPAWAVNVLKQLKMGRPILVNGGEGLCNAVYIDDMVSAILLAAVEDNAVGEAFLISGEQPVTWRKFYGRYEQMLGFSSTVNMSVAEAETYYAKKRRKGSLLKEALSILREEQSVRQRVRGTLEVATLMEVARLLLPKQIQQSLIKRIRNDNRMGQPQITPEAEKPILPLHPSIVRFNATKTRVCVDKAKRLLGYQPAFDFESGMKLTEQWARWANLLDN